MSRRRYQAKLQAPDCPHRAEAYAAYQEQVQARRERPYGTAGDPWPEEPYRGYCEDCRQALYASREPWPADVWAFLDKQAALDYQPGTRAILKSKPSLPKYHGGRVETLGKLYARACEAFPTDATDSRLKSAIGLGFGQGFGVVTTNGHGAIVKQGAVTQDRTTQIIKADSSYVDLPADFHAALKRVRLFASEHSNAVHLSIGPWRLRLHAADSWGNEASETVELAGPGHEVPEYQVCLNADYLDAVCGVWPLRWYLRAGSEMEPQSFQPAGADWRAVIMPMRM